MTSTATERSPTDTAPPPIRAVVFDLHQTLVDGGDADRWVQLAWQHLGRGGEVALPDGTAVDELATWLEDVWEHAREVDPDSQRDLDGATHRRVFDATVASAPGVDPALTAALYATLPDALAAYEDARPVLAALHTAGVRTAVLSNIGFDVRPLLDRDGLSPYLDTVVLSFETGVKKPDPRIFEIVLDRLGTAPGDTLMVGDSWRDDAGAAALGMRTLLLPRTRGPVHGLGAVLRLVGS